MSTSKTQPERPEVRPAPPDQVPASTPALLLAATAIVAAMWFFPAAAFGQTVTGLSVDFGDLEPVMEEELREELQDYFDESRSYDWLAFEDGVGQLDEELHDCFEELCLLQISQQLEAAVGLTIDVDVEHEIYEWTVEFYDLLEGRLLTTEQGICELCGRSEVAEQFRASIAGPLATMDVSDPDDELPEDADDIEEERLTEVRFTAIPEDTEIHVDEELVGSGEATVELGKGVHHVRFSHDTHHAVSDRISVDEESAPRVVMRVHLQKADGEPGEIPLREPGALDGLDTTRSVMGWTAVGMGLVGLGAAIWLARLDGQPACSGDVELRDCPDIYSTTGWAAASAGLGVAGLTAGTTLLMWPWLAGRQRPPLKATVDEPKRRLPAVGISIGGRF